MKTVNLLGVLFVAFSSRAVAQNSFSVYTNLYTQPTKEIKANNTLLGLGYTHKFGSKYKLVADVEYTNKGVTYLEPGYSGSFLAEFNKLESNLAFSYSYNDKYAYHIKIQPFIANEQQLNLRSFYMLSELTVAIKLKENKILTIGAGNSTVFGQSKLTPVVSYKYSYSDKLNFLIGFPESAISYSNNARNIFALKNSFNGSFYALHAASKSIFDTSEKASFSQVTTSFEYERSMDTNWFVGFKAGYDLDRKYRLLDSDGNTVFDFGIKDGINLNIKIKYKL